VHASEAGATGTLEVLHSIARGHVEAGIRATFLLGRRPESPRDLGAGFPQSPLIEVKELAGWASRSPTQQIAGIRALRDELRRVSPSLVVLHASFAGFAGLALTRKIPIAYVPHAFASCFPGSRAKNLVLRIAESAVCRRANLVVAVSESEAAVARARFARRVVVIHNGIAELDSPTEHDTAARESIVVAVGRIVPQKLPDEVGRLLAGVEAQKYWVGDGDGDFAEVARRELEASGVRVTGWCSRDEVRETLRKAQIYLHWTAWDGLSISLLEAIADGAIAIGSDIPPNREVLGPEFVFASPDSAAVEIEQLLADPSRLMSARKAQLKLSESFGERSMHEAWNALVASF
jgi:glycosyltransferase involved in cell wall biosynthesis